MITIIIILACIDTNVTNGHKIIQCGLFFPFLLASLSISVLNFLGMWISEGEYMLHKSVRSLDFSKYTAFHNPQPTASLGFLKAFE